MIWGVIVVFFIGWIIVKAIEGISTATSSITGYGKDKQTFNAQRLAKYPNRVVDTTKGLFERNRDIIENFERIIKIKPKGNSHSFGSGKYYLDNLTIDCINEICLAENNFRVYPGKVYLPDWSKKAPSDWLKLSQDIKSIFVKRNEQLLIEQEEKNKKEQERLRLIEQTKRQERDEEDRKKRLIADIKNKLYWIGVDFSNYKKNVKVLLQKPKIQKKPGKGNLCIEELNLVLKPNILPWLEKEKELLNFKNNIKEFPTASFPMELSPISELNKEIQEFNTNIKSEIQENIEFPSLLKKVINGYKKSVKEDVIARFNFILNDIHYPDSIMKSWDIDFDTDQSIMIVEIGLPDVVHTPVYKKVKLKNNVVEKVLSQREAKEEIPKIHPAIILRTAFEIFKNDDARIIKLLVLNGWVKYDNPATGQITKTYTASLMVERGQIEGMNLTKIDPLTAFLNLKGKSAGKLIEIIPVTPTMSLDRKDSRFIATTEVLNKLGSATNLASMDWQDFESLIAELFEKEFAKEGAEVKVTQASRDRGVDAVIFDPDPIRGGKIIVQAKRYANTVDVSAVRDLCAVVKKEGAIKGILVTTSTFGGDAYKFANNEPVTLLNGAELLGLLKKHGYTFRINLDEARKFNLANTEAVK
jgi:restriction system protein